MSELSYFDTMCDKNNIVRKYLHYVHPTRLKVVLLKYNDGLTIKKICEQMNNGDFTPYKVEEYLRQARIKTHEIWRAAELFAIQDKIIQKSLDELKKQVSDYYENEKEEE